MPVRLRSVFCKETDRMAKTKWKKIIVAGALVKECIYPAVSCKDAPKTRAAKHKMSSDAQRRMNAVYSWQKLELILAANFRRGDLVCTFTFDDKHLPRDRKEVSARLKYFRQKLTAARKSEGDELVMVWSIEHRHGDGRWHIHAAINATGDDYAEIRDLWGLGLVDISPLRVDKEKNYETLARYWTKEAPDKLGARTWSYTRSCKQPEIETFRVEADTPLDVPKGAISLEEHRDKTVYGSYQYIKYLGADVPQRVLARRRRRPRR